MSENLIIIPVHPPDFHWVTKLLDSAFPSENIGLGFSNKEDANLFKHTFPFKTLISNIPNNKHMFISKKKLDLIKQTYNDYKYIAVIDAESKFLKPVTNVLEEIWNNNCFLANHSIDGKRIMKELANLCGYNNHNDDLYPWFNCIPIFKTALLLNFFTWLDERKETLNSLSGFDFLLFAMYCRYELNMSWKILEGHAWHGLVENRDEWMKSHNKHLIHEVIWSTYIKNIEQYPNIRMLFHLDRYS